MTPRFVRRLVTERRVPYFKVGKFIRFDPAELESWLANCRVDQRDKLREIEASPQRYEMDRVGGRCSDEAVRGSS